MLRLPPLYAIVDAGLAARHRWQPPALARALVAGGARLIQLRAKEAEGAVCLRWADEIVEAARSSGCRVIVNDRVDIARMAGAAGVHVGQDDLSVDGVRRLLGPAALVGVSTHTEAEIDAVGLAARGESPAAFDRRCIPPRGVTRRSNTPGIFPPPALRGGRLDGLGATQDFHHGLLGDVSYLAVGPVFETDSKATGHEAVGLALVRYAVSRAPGIPVVAIGGITLERAPAVIEAGAAAVAVISDLLADGDPERRARAYAAALGT